MDKGVVQDGEELSLMINNERHIYEEMIRPTQINMAKKMVNGTYSALLAKKAWLNLVDAAVKDRKFVREVLHDWKPSAPVRRVAAELVMQHQHSEVVDKSRKMLALKNAGKPWRIK